MSHNDRVLAQEDWLDPQPYMDAEEAAGMGEEIERCLSRHVFGDDGHSFGEVARSIYKYTDCGPWMRLTDRGVEIGSIVEGSDAYVGPILLEPDWEAEDVISAEAFWGAIEQVNAEATYYWNRDNGAQATLADYSALEHGTYIGDGESGVYVLAVHTYNSDGEYFGWIEAVADTNSYTDTVYTASTDSPEEQTVYIRMALAEAYQWLFRHGVTDYDGNVVLKSTEVENGYI